MLLLLLHGCCVLQVWEVCWGRTGYSGCKKVMDLKGHSSQVRGGGRGRGVFVCVEGGAAEFNREEQEGRKQTAYHGPQGTQQPGGGGGGACVCAWGAQYRGYMEYTCMRVCEGG